MTWIEALILGLLQGLTEFLPVSSSGHLAIGQALFHTNADENLLFTVYVHGATVLSTIVVLFSEISRLVKEGLKFRYNEETSYILKILLSTIPVLIVGLFFEDFISTLFEGNLYIVGAGLLLTALLLAVTMYVKRERKSTISYRDAFIMGIAQTIAIMPGLSRSGSTISTGILLGNNKQEVTRFSFLMVLIPVIGANFLDLVRSQGDVRSGLSTGILVTGFMAAFISGLIACKWMISLVKRGNLIYFSIYCLLLGITAIIFAENF